MLQTRGGGGEGTNLFVENKFTSKLFAGKYEVLLSLRGTFSRQCKLLPQLWEEATKQ